MEDALILLSGGIDSASCLAFYKNQELRVSGIFVDYGQATRRREKASAFRLAQHYGIELSVIEYSGRIASLPVEIPGRNAFLIFAALVFKPDQHGLLTLGIHAGTPYYDCSRIFFEDAGRIVTAYSNGRVALAAPFLDWTKPMIYEFAQRVCLPFELTWSCEVGPDVPCGNCLSCRDREELNVRTS